MKLDTKQSEWWCWLDEEENPLKHGEPSCSPRFNRDISPQDAAELYAKRRWHEEFWTDDVVVNVADNIGQEDENEMIKHYFQFSAVKTWDGIDIQFLKEVKL